MTKEEIIKAIWNELPDQTLNDERKICDTTKLIKDRLSKGEDVDLKGFGTLVREKKQRMGRNPRTLKESVIKERREVYPVLSPAFSDTPSDRPDRLNISWILWAVHLLVISHGSSVP